MDDIAFVGTRMALDHSLTPDSFPVPTYLFFKGDERPGRNDVGLPLMQCVLVKTASGATGNESTLTRLLTHSILINLFIKVKSD